jgi:PEP-CTERM motif-containing protein
MIGALEWVVEGLRREWLMRNLGRAALVLSMLWVASSARAIETPRFVTLSIEDRFGTVLDDQNGQPATATIRTDLDFLDTTLPGVGAIREGTIHFTMPTPDLMDDTSGSVQIVDPNSILFVHDVINQMFSNGQNGTVVQVNLFAIDPGFFCTPQGVMGDTPLCQPTSFADDGGPTDVSHSLFSGVAPFRVVVSSGTVPEPGTAVLLGLGVGLVAARRLRGRRASSF